MLNTHCVCAKLLFAINKPIKTLRTDSSVNTGTRLNGRHRFYVGRWRSNTYSWSFSRTLLSFNLVSE